MLLMKVEDFLRKQRGEEQTNNTNVQYTSLIFGTCFSVFLEVRINVNSFSSLKILSWQILNIFFSTYTLMIAHNNLKGRRGSGKDLNECKEPGSDFSLPPTSK